MLKRNVAKAKQAPILLLLILAALAVMAVPAWADTSIPYADQVKSLLTTGLGWITGIIGTGGSLMFAYHALMRNFIPDPQSVAHHTESMRKVAIGTALGGGASGLGTWLSNTFAGSNGANTTGMLFTHHAAMVAMVAGKFFGV